MNPRRFVMACTLLACAALGFAPERSNAQCYNGHCAPSYSGGYSRGYSYGRSYSHAPRYYQSPRYYNTQSEWVTRPWPSDTRYFWRYYTAYDHCGNWTNHGDGWLYRGYWHNGSLCYEKHCRIDAYAAGPYSPDIDPRGSTDVGYRADEYELAKRFPAYTGPGMLKQSDIPGFVDPKSVIADFVPNGEARDAHAVRISTSANEVAGKLLTRSQDIEERQIAGRDALARQAQRDNAVERKLAKLNELLATIEKTAVIDSDPATARGGQVAFDTSLVKADAAELLNSRCVSCHGPTKQAGKLDLRDYASFDAKRWRTIRAKCETGEMPQGGEPLTDAELQTLDEQVTFAAAKS